MCLCGRNKAVPYCGEGPCIWPVKSLPVEKCKRCTGDGICLDPEKEQHGDHHFYYCALCGGSGKAQHKE